jgi:methionyl-tRNA formyltransferase
MKIALIGTRWFGAEVFRLLQEAGHEVVVTATNGEDTLAKAARFFPHDEGHARRPRRVTGEDIPVESVDAILAAHTHAFVTADARKKARIASIGYHPSLLPRHRGVAAVEWTMKEKDPIAGGSIYHLSGGMDAGALAAQDWCFVYPDDDARSLWQRALAPMGLRLLMKVVADMDTRGYADSFEQDPKAVTLAPALS